MVLFLQTDSERESFREQMMAKHEEDVREFLLKHAGEPASKIMKKKQELQKQHEKGSESV